MWQKLKIKYEDNKMWFYLLRFILFSILLSIVVVLVDTKMLPIQKYIPEVFLTSLDLAKTIMGTIAGALLTMTTFTFSIIMVVLTMYSSDFTPRVVENFLQSKTTMKVLGIFVGGFLYSIISLFFLRDAYSDYSIISASIAIIYSIVCILYFVVFVFSVSDSIQVTKLISKLYDESYNIIEKIMEFRKDKKRTNEVKIGIYRSNMEIFSKENGYLEVIDFSWIQNIIKEMDCKLVIHPRIGDFVSKKQKIATFYYNDEEVVENLEDKIINTFSLLEDKMILQDYNFSLQKIVEIATRAISPGINDPNTTIHCIRILGVLLGRLSETEGKYLVIERKNSKSKIIYEDINVKTDIYYVFYQIIHYGKEDISVVLALFEAIEIIQRRATSQNINDIKEFSSYIYDSVIENFKNNLDVRRIKEMNESIQNA